MSATTIIDSMIAAHQFDEKCVMEAKNRLNDSKILRFVESVKAIATLPGSIERKIYSEKVASAFNLPLEAVNREVEINRKELLAKAREELAQRDSI